MGTVSLWHWIMVLIMFAALFAAYFLPGIIASRRKHKDRAAIWLLTFFTGWTGIGWVVGLVWAFTNQAPQVIVVDRAEIEKVSNQ